MEGLRAEHLFFSRRAGFSLGPLSFSLHPGELCCIVGSNGSGKSTFMQLLAAVLPASGGELFVQGLPLKGMNRREIAARLGYLPQEVRSLYTFSVERVVAMGRFCLDGGQHGKRVSREAVIGAMEKTETLHLAKRSFATLSGGERQRVLLASVLSRKPEILLLDEPSTGLDPHHGADLFRRLREAAGEGNAVLVVSHDINLAAAFGHRMVFMEGGKILADGSPEVVLRSGALAASCGGSMACWPHPDGRGGSVLLPLREA